MPEIAGLPLAEYFIAGGRLAHLCDESGEPSLATLILEDVLDDLASKWPEVVGRFTVD
jgi:hypothetical protein